jgi:hypothetical protein
LASGKTPPQNDVPSDLSYEEMLLYVAWIFGLETEDTIHRMTLFAIGLVSIVFPDGHMEVNDKLITQEEISRMQNLGCIVYLPDNGREV